MQIYCPCLQSRYGLGAKAICATEGVVEDSTEGITVSPPFTSMGLMQGCPVWKPAGYDGINQQASPLQTNAHDFSSTGEGESGQMPSSRATY